MSEKTAVLAPRPRARVRIAVAAKPGERCNWRSPKSRSRLICSIMGFLAAGGRFPWFGKAAEAAQGGAAGICRGHPSGNVVLGGQVDVAAELFFERGVEFPSAEEGCEAVGRERIWSIFAPLLGMPGWIPNCWGKKAAMVLATRSQFRFLFDLFAAQAAERVELGAAIGFGDAHSELIQPRCSRRSRAG